MAVQEAAELVRNWRGQLGAMEWCFGLENGPASCGVGEKGPTKLAKRQPRPRITTTKNGHGSILRDQEDVLGSWGGVSQFRRNGRDV